MPSPDATNINCPGCGKAFAWKAIAAGRKVLCVCGVKFRMPATPNGPAISLMSPDAAPPIDALPEAIDHEDSKVIALVDDSGELLPVTPSAPQPVMPAQPGPSIPVAEGLEPLELAGEPEPQSSAAPIDLAGDTGIPPFQPAAPGTPPAPAQPIGECPQCKAPVNPDAVICLGCGLNFQSGEQISTAMGVASDAPGDGNVLVSPSGKPEVMNESLARALKGAQRDLDYADELERKHLWTEYYIPAILTGVAVVMLLFDVFILKPQVVQYTMYADMLPGDSTLLYSLFLLFGNALKLVIQMPILLVALFLTASLFGASYGRLLSALLKLLAMALLMTAVDASLSSFLDLITEGLGFLGFFITASVTFGLFFALCISLFDMDANEIMVMYFLVVLAPALGMGFLLTMLAPLFF